MIEILKGKLHEENAQFCHSAKGSCEETHEHHKEVYLMQLAADATGRMLHIAIFINQSINQVDK